LEVVLLDSKNRKVFRMRRAALAGFIFVMAWSHELRAQSVVFVSPSTKGLVTMPCAEGSLHSFEQVHYLAAAHYLAERVCLQPRIDGGVGIWKGQAQNSGMIDGCANDGAREVGALLGKYYHQAQALIFDRNPAGKTSLVSFRASQPLGIIAIMMAQAKVSGATVIPHADDNLVLIVAIDPEQLSRALSLYSLLHARGLREEAGNTELIGDEDRGKARDVYAEILSHAPLEVRQLGDEIYSEQFNDLGLAVTTTH
jgi:hypothetical protein